MAKLIKKAEVEQFKFNIGDKVKVFNWWTDGRVSYNDEHRGIVVKINRVTVDVKVENGDIWRVNKDEVYDI